MHDHVPFLRPTDLRDFLAIRDSCFEMVVAAHELIGHGCGKLLREKKPFEFNFDVKKPPVSPISKEPITTWYKLGETPKSGFRGIASSYNECLAEAIGLYLILDQNLQQILSSETEISSDTSESFPPRKQNEVSLI